MMRLNIKKTVFNIGILLVFSVLILPIFVAVHVSAQTGDLQYTVLAPLPGTTNGVCNPAIQNDPNCQTTLQKYLPGLFNLLIGLSAAAAVLMIVIGGFQYMSTDAIQGKTDGKERIINAIYGLVLVIGAWLILYTINPNLLNLNLNIESVTTSAPPGSAGTLTNSKTTLSEGEAAIRSVLTQNGITWNAGPCSGTQTTGCTNLDGLPVYALTDLISLKNNCNCDVKVTGGTEGGHISHGVGLGQVDMGFSSTLDSYITTNAKSTGTVNINGVIYPTYTISVNGQDTKLIKEADHWHAAFK